MKALFTNPDRLKVILRTLIPASIILSAVFIIQPMNIYPLVMLQSMAIHALLIYLLLAIVFLFRKAYLISGASFLSFTFLLLFLWPHIFINRNLAQNPEVDLKVTHFNVLLFNSDHKSTIDAASSSNADILSFQEVDQRWYNSLYAALHSKYPYSIDLSANDHCFGLTLFSKYPLSNINTSWILQKPIVEADVVVKGRKIHIITLHTSSPIGTQRFHKRNLMLATLREKVLNNSDSKLIIGDLNTVPWDQNLSEIITSGSLIDSRSHYGGTYPSWLPVGRIPIDYILHTTDLNCSHFDIIDNTSSDHLGITSSFTFNTNKNVASN